MAYKRISPQPVMEGGTQLSSTTPYAVVCGGTIGTGALQQVSGLGSSGQALVTGGSGALPTWQTVSSSGSWVLIENKALSSSLSTVFSTGMDTTYINYALLIQGCLANNTTDAKVEFSINGGSTFPSAIYRDQIIYGRTNPVQDPVSWSNTSYDSYLPIINGTLIAGSLAAVIFLHGVGNPMNTTWTGQSYFNVIIPGACNGLLQGIFNTSGSAVNAIRFSNSGFFTGSVALYGITK